MESTVVVLQKFDNIHVLSRVKPSLIHTQWHYILQYCPKLLCCIYYFSMLYILCFYIVYIFLHVVHIMFIFYIYYVTKSDPEKL